MTMEAREDLIERLRAALRVDAADGDGQAIKRALAGQHPADIAEVMEQLTHAEALVVFAGLDTERAAEVLDDLDPERVRYLLENAPRGRIAELLDRLPMDEAAEVVAEATPEQAETLMADLTARAPADAAEVRELLSYGEHTAGRLMTDKFVRLSPTLTVDEAFTRVRNMDADVETLTDLYVVAALPRGEERLIGVLSLRELVRAEPRRRIRDVMTTKIISVTVDTDQEEVAQIISRYHFLALPVLDRQGALAGIVTIDDVVDILVEEQTEDVLKQGGIEPGVIDQPYFSVPIWRVVRSRVTWLVLLFVAETATGSVLRHFGDELAKVTALAFFIPLLIGTGGNTGAQTVSTIIRGMALREIRPQDMRRVFLRELSGGLLLGLVIGLIAFGRALIWHSGLQLSLVVGLTILAVCAWANTIGSLIPLVAQQVRVDPALISAPLITTLVDATGLVIYLLIAKAILPQLQ